MRLYALKASEVLEQMTMQQRQESLSLLCVSRQEKVKRLRNEELKDKSMLTGLLIGYGIFMWITQPEQEMQMKNITDIELLLQKNREYEKWYGKPKIAFGAEGKPYFPMHAEIHFNVSHSGDYILLAVAKEEVGIDIEEITSSNMDVAKRCFHEKEYKALQASDGKLDLQKELFYTYWAAKESYVKCTGKGLSQSFSSFWVDLEQGVVWEDEKTKFHITMLEVDSQYKAAVCMIT